MIELSISTSLENKIASFTNELYRICTEWKLFNDITDQTIIGDLHRVELQNLSYEERAIEKEIALRVIKEFSYSEIYQSNLDSFIIGFRKLRKYYNNKEQLKATLLNEMTSSKRTIEKFRKSKKTRKDIEICINENIKECPLSNVIGMFEIYSNY